MLNPHAGESQQDFMARFMGSPEAESDYPDQQQRAAVGYSMFRGRQNAADTKWTDLDDDEREALTKIMSEPAKPRANSRGQAGKTVPMRFIEPGLVNYSDVGMVLVKKETLDKMLGSIVGKPIFNESHKDVSDDDFAAGKAQGIMAGNPRFNPQDGWFWADALIWDNETLKNGRDGYSLSCAYDVRRWGPGGVHNNIPYDREVLEGEYTHLAIVNNPRYEGARLIINQGGAMKLKFWQKSKEKPEEQFASEVELANSKLEVEGKEVGLEDVIAGFKADEARKALANSKIEMDTLIEIDGKKVKVSELVAGFKSNLANSSDDEEKEKKEKEERKNAEEKEKAEKEKKDKDDRENAKNEDDHKKGDHGDKPMENCLACKADSARKNAAHFDDLRNARNKGLEEFREPGLKTAAERVEEGNRRYGSVKP